MFYTLRINLNRKILSLIVLSKLALESIEVDTSAGSVSINFPAASSSSSGSSSSNTGEAYNPGLFDTLPHIRLEGLTEGVVYAMSFFLLSAYIIVFVLYLLNLWPSTDRVSGMIENKTLSLKNLLLFLDSFEYTFLNFNDNLFQIYIRILLGSSKTT